MWNYTAFSASKLAVVISTIVLARLLVPEDFGLMALGLLVINYLERLKDLGAGPALIYSQEDPDRTGSVAFVLSLVSVTTLAVIAFFGAPAAAWFFEDDRVTPVVRALAVAFFVSGLGVIHESRLRKFLDFRRRLIPEVASAVVKGGVSIGLAVAGLGVWSLVWGQIAGVTVGTILYWTVARWRPRWIWDPVLARQIIRYGLPMVGVSLLSVVLDNIDYLVIGRRMEADALGFYTLGFRIPELVILSFCIVMSQVLFPTFSQLQNDPKELRASYLTTLRYIALITVPAGIGLAIVAEAAVIVLYGDRWEAAIPVMRLLSLYALVYSLGFHSGDVYKATGRPGILNWLTLFDIMLALPVLWIASGYTIVHVAAAMLALNVLFSLVRFVIVSRIVAISARELLHALAPSLKAGSLMALALIGVDQLVPAIPWAIRLVVLISLGALAYLLGLRVAAPETFAQFKEVTRRLRGRAERTEPDADAAVLPPETENYP